MSFKTLALLVFIAIEVLLFFLGWFLTRSLRKEIKETKLMLKGKRKTLAEEYGEKLGFEYNYRFPIEKNKQVIGISSSSRIPREGKGMIKFLNKQALCICGKPLASKSINLKVNGKETIPKTIYWCKTCDSEPADNFNIYVSLFNDFWGDRLASLTD